MLHRASSKLRGRKTHEEVTQVKRKVKSQEEARTHAHLWVSVCEARELPRMDVGGKSDGYVIVQAGHHLHRTRTVWKNLNPFWGDDVKFDVTDGDLKEIVFTVWDQNKHLQDDIIGQVVIPLDDIKDQQLHEKFFPIQQPSEDFVSGDIKLHLTYSPPKGDADGSLIVLVKKARNLAVKDANGLSDPYVKVKLGAQKKKTKIVKRNLSPTWDEEFTFKVPAKVASEQMVEVTVWDWDMVSSADFMGEVHIPLKDLQPNTPIFKWFILSASAEEGKEEEGAAGEEGKKPKVKKTFKHMSKKIAGKQHGHLGDLRVKVKYTEQQLLPLSSYTDLLQLLLTEEEVVGWLYDYTKEAGLLAASLVAIFHSQGKATQLLQFLTRKEIRATKSSGVIFRGNTLATKCVDAFMKLIGSSYLKHVLKDDLVTISEDKHSCEVDPSKVEKGENVQQNMLHLRETAEKISNHIFDSTDTMPAQFREVFYDIRKTIAEQWPEDDTSRYTAVSGFIFLRFFNPAILGPRLFGLFETFPSFVASRTFTLISKILQNLANLIEFGQKEPFLADMNEYIHARTKDMKQFLDTVSSLAPADREGLVDTPDIDLQLEMASIFHHLTNMRQAIAQHCGQAANYAKLCSILDAISNPQGSHSAAVPSASTTPSSTWRPSSFSGPRSGLIAGGQRS